MVSFIKVVEIWKPVADQQGLCLADALYGNYEALRGVSENRIFRFGEGLPGKAWSTARPQFITDIANSYFQRKEVAKRLGLNVGLAIPVIAGEHLVAVLVLLCGEGEYLSGAIELWSKSADNAQELEIVDGHYGTLEKLKMASQGLRFTKGNGLPGTVWDYHIPIVTNMHDSSLFKRTGSASVEGISSAIGLPLTNYLGKEYVLTFLSAHSTPIARRFDIWIPNREENTLFLHASYSENGEDILDKEKPRKVRQNENLLGFTWMTGIPTISRDLVGDRLVLEPTQETLSSGLLLPIIEDGFLRAIVVFMF